MLSGLWDSEILKGIWILSGESDNSKDLQGSIQEWNINVTINPYSKSFLGLYRKGWDTLVSKSAFFKWFCLFFALFE